MLHISPSEIKILSDDELTRFGLNKNDPYWEDAEITKIAKGYGLSKIEYMQRNESAYDLCWGFFGDDSKYDKCISNVLRGRPPGDGIK